MLPHFSYRNYDEAIRVMQRAAAIPKNPKINYHDHVCSLSVTCCCPSKMPQSLSVQARLFKSLKLWSFYVDLEESLGTVASTKAVYDKILELRIANAQIIVNYAAFLEENKYFEESFKVSIKHPVFERHCSHFWCSGSGLRAWG